MAYWVTLHVDFNQNVKPGILNKLNRIMCNLDYDWQPSEVYADGIRMRCRAPLYSQETLILNLQKLRVSGRGYFLPTGTGCSCEICTDFSLGDAFCCDATPQPDDWFEV